MCAYRKIDLSAVCNHKLIYENAENINDAVGLDGEYIEKRDVKIAQNDEINGVPFRFCLDDKDNVQCDGQTLALGAYADVLHVIGFAYWGDTFDMITVRYADGSEEQIKLPFADWAHKVSDDYRDVAWLGNNIRTVRYMIGSGKSDHMACLHHSDVRLRGGVRIESITLPENFFLHVMAMTLEVRDI